MLASLTRASPSHFLRLSNFSILYLLQVVLLAQAPKPPPVSPEEPRLPDIPKDPQINGQSRPKATAAGAIAEGLNPKVSANDEEIDIEKIGEILKDLLKKIIDAVTDIQTSTTTDARGSPTTTVITTRSPPDAAYYPCGAAWQAYTICSSTYTDFANLPRTVQAGCLCNAYSDYNFNTHMLDCYSFVNKYPATAFQSSATAIASATLLCAPSTCTYATTDGVLDRLIDPCTPVMSTPAPSATATSPASTTAAQSSGGAEGTGNARKTCYVLPMVFWAVLMPALF
jgi:hypothetical protein